MADARFGRPELLVYLHASPLGVVSTLGPDGAPQSALVGIGVTETLEVVFDTASTSRKHANLERDPRVALVIAGPAEQTLQLQGRAEPVPTHGREGEEAREAYYLAWPDGRDRLNWPNLAYWRIAPVWARYTDYDRGPLIAEFTWP